MVSGLMGLPYLLLVNLLLLTVVQLGSQVLPTIPTAPTKPPARTPVLSVIDGTMQPLQEKSRIPVLEMDLVNQLSKEEQTSLNLKFQEAADVDQKVPFLSSCFLYLNVCHNFQQLSNWMTTFMSAQVLNKT